MSKLPYLFSAGSWLLPALTMLLAEPTARADEYQDHVDRGSQLTLEQHYRDALREFQVAYSIKQNPPLFLAMARLQMQLGDGKEALDSYRRYQLAVPQPELSVQRETEDAIAHLTAVYEPRPVSPQGTVVTLAQLDALLSVRGIRNRTDDLRHRNTSLMAGGGVLFGLGYAAAFLTGSLFLGTGACNNYGVGYNYTNSGSKDGQCVAANAMLIVPIIGPVVGGLIEPVAAWSVPWIFVDGAAQIGGLAMMIVAARSNHSLAQKSPLTNLQLLPYSTARQSGITLAGRF